MERGHLDWCHYLLHHDCCGDDNPAWSEEWDCNCGGPWVSVPELERRATCGPLDADDVVTMTSVREAVEA